MLKKGESILEQIINQDQLSRDVWKRFYPLFKDLLRKFHTRLVSVSVYGSATGQNYVDNVSDINSVFIFEKLDFETLKAALKAIARTRKKNVTAPLFLTRDYIEASLDVFPLEFLEMKDNHIVVYGEDVLNGLEIKAEHLRLFCEQQVKGKLVRIRQAYLEVGLDTKGIETLLKDSLTSLFPVLRGLIRLRNAQPVTEKSEVIRQVCELYEMDSDVLLSIYKDKIDDEKIGQQECEIYLEAYVNLIRDLAIKVDRL